MWPLASDPCGHAHLCAHIFAAYFSSRYLRRPGTTLNSPKRGCATTGQRSIQHPQGATCSLPTTTWTCTTPPSLQPSHRASVLPSVEACYSAASPSCTLLASTHRRSGQLEQLPTLPLCVQCTYCCHSVHIRRIFC